MRRGIVEMVRFTVEIISCKLNRLMESLFHTKYLSNIEYIKGWQNVLLTLTQSWKMTFCMHFNPTIYSPISVVTDNEYRTEAAFGVAL